MRAISRTLLLLLLLAYTGQSALLVASPCTLMSDHAGGVEHDMSGMDHAGHGMSMHTASAAADCCDGGYCSASHCQAAPGIISPFYVAATGMSAVLIAARPVSALNPPLESPYRPPTVA